MERALPLNVIIRECLFILEVFSSKDEPLLFSRNAVFFITNSFFDGLDGVGRLCVDGAGLAVE
jgi:hypothetical protein